MQLAKEWYITITGKQPYFDQPFYVGFDINGCELGLDPDMSNTTTGNQAVSYWAVDNVADALNKLSEMVQPLFSPGQMWAVLYM